MGHIAGVAALAARMEGLPSMVRIGIFSNPDICF
jgi:hypothetical protein